MAGRFLKKVFLEAIVPLLGGGCDAGAIDPLLDNGFLKISEKRLKTAQKRSSNGRSEIGIGVVVFPCRIRRLQPRIFGSYG